MMLVGDDDIPLKKKIYTLEGPHLNPRSRSNRNFLLDPDFSSITSQAFAEWIIAKNSDSESDYD